MSKERSLDRSKSRSGSSRILGFARHPEDQAILDVSPSYETERPGRRISEVFKEICAAKIKKYGSEGEKKWVKLINASKR